MAEPWDEKYGVSLSSHLSFSSYIGLCFQRSWFKLQPTLDALYSHFFWDKYHLYQLDESYLNWATLEKETADKWAWGIGSHISASVAGLEISYAIRYYPSIFIVNSAMSYTSHSFFIKLNIIDFSNVANYKINS